MASVKTTGKPTWYFQELAEDGDSGCSSASAYQADRTPLAAHEPKGDPLQDLLQLEQLASEEGFADVRDYIDWLQTQQGYTS